MRNSTLFWGLVLIFLGIAFLLANFFQVNVWAYIWPLLLIFAGIWILLGALFRRSGKTQQLALPLEGAAAARLKISHGAGRLSLRGSAAPGELLAGSFGGGVNVDRRKVGDAADVWLSLPSAVFTPFDWMFDGGLDWSLSITDQIPIEVELETGAGETTADFSRTMLTRLILKTGASSSRVIFPSSPGLITARVESGVASINLQIPEGTAGLIRVDSGLSGIDIDTARFPRQNGEYMTPGYHTAQNRIEIDVSTGVASLTIR